MNPVKKVNYINWLINYSGISGNSKSKSKKKKRKKQTIVVSII